MGQPVSVVQKPSATPGRVRFEINRSLTGQGHERYASISAANGVKPADVLAQRLFATGKVSAVHVYSNVITVDVAEGASNDGLAKVVEDLYQYWKPGMAPKSTEELLAMVPKSAETTSVPTADAGGAPVSAAASKIPVLLLVRSQAALAKARAQ
ncbi:MAG: hypothetical protein O3A54_02440 [Actinobacteria bacterium]|nr:hypothetical protein [Actinomycetota bacterium]